MREHGFTSFLALAALLIVSAASVSAQAPPNVLLITVDDMNWDSVGVYGAKIPNLTPNIDRLASEGLRFEYAHVTIAICQPTRAVWMTGRYPHNSGAFGFDEIRPDVPTLVEALRDAGFRTGLMAKHGHVVPSRADAWTEIVPARELKNGRSPELYYERALRFMNAAKAAGQPFFLMANSQDPHRPFAASADEAKAQETDAASKNHQYGGGFPPAELAFDPGEIPVSGFLPDLPDIRRELAEYYTSVKRADETVGAVLRALDDAGLADGTLVMFLSDHGIAVPFAKTNVWMHSTRTPWIIRWPGVTERNAVDGRHVVSGIDLAPTVLAAVGKPPLRGTDGHSFLGALRGEELDGFDFAFTHMNVTIAPEWYPMRSIVDRQFGYIYNAWADGKKQFFNNSMRGLTYPAMAAAAPNDPAIAARVDHLLYRTKEELYDYTSDPDALVNLAESPDYESVVAKYRQLMLEQMRATADPQLDGYEQFLRPPNVVIIFTDDQGYGDVGVYGAEGFETPNLDEMAAEGIRFTDFLVTSPACSPSRAALLTGSYAVRVGIPEVLFPQDDIGLAKEELTLAELLKDRGYATAIFGKWHLGHHPEHLPLAHGFDEYFGIPYSNDMTPDVSKNPNPAAQRHPPLPLVEGLEVIEIEPDQSQLTRRYTEHAVDFIERNRDRPFFLYLPHTMPHMPLFASERFRGTTERGLYGDVIEEIDGSVGEILDTLERLGLDNQTLVMFMSDNGPWLIKGDNGGSAGPFREGKATVFEGGHRIPAIMRWPGHIPEGIVSDELASTMDVLPTVAGLVGAELPDDRVIDGKDIWPLLSGQPGAKSPHEVFYYYWPSELRAVRSGKWKLHLPHQYTSIEGAQVATPTFHGIYSEAEIGLSLFNLDQDEGETTDVSDENPEVVERLLALAEAARKDLGDSLTGRTGAGVRKPVAAPD